MADVKKYDAHLNYDELMVLDANCSAETQAIVDKAKEEKSYGLDAFCNTILREAVMRGELTWGGTRISQCLYCASKPRGYHAYSRSSRYHRKGSPNYDAPYSYAGVDPFPGFVVLHGVSGTCSECWHKKYLPQIVNYIIENDLQVQLQKNEIAETKWRKDPIRICFKCGLEMYESEMGEDRTLMGDGTYKSTCPHCGAKSLIFGASHKTTDKFRMLKRGNEVRSDG